MGVLSIMHPDAESAAAPSRRGTGVPYILSSASSTPMEQVAEAMGGAERWFQLYWAKDREVTRSFLDRAKAAGFTALFVTLDTPLLAWRPRDLDQAYLPFLHGVGTANYFSDPAFQAGLAKPVHESRTRPCCTSSACSRTRARPGPISRSCGRTRTGRSSSRASCRRTTPDAPPTPGWTAWSSPTTASRQVAGSVAAADALPRVVEAVGERLTVLFDSGIRTGDDVFKALALGARAVLVGRPYAYGLGLDGQAGVEHVVRCLLAEFDLTLALSGHARPATLGPDDLIETRMSTTTVRPPTRRSPRWRVSNVLARWSGPRRRSHRRCRARHRLPWRGQGHRRGDDRTRTWPRCARPMSSSRVSAR